MMPLSQQQRVRALRNLFLDSIRTFARAEADNIVRGTSERNLCSRLAFTIEQNSKATPFSDYFAEVEYNRKQNGEVKTIIDDKLEFVQITCDIIFHSRGRSVRHDNLIAIEMKRREHSPEEKNKDHVRLRAMTKPTFDGIWSNDGETHPEHVCGYELGYFIELDTRNRNFGVQEYMNGSLYEQTTIEF